MDKIELKPCPFCGGEAIFRFISTYSSGGDRCIGYDFKIVCSNCGITLPSRYEIRFRIKEDGEFVIEKDDREKAANDWNRRITNERTD